MNEKKPNTTTSKRNATHKNRNSNENWRLDQRKKNVKKNSHSEPNHTFSINCVWCDWGLCSFISFAISKWQKKTKTKLFLQWSPLFIFHQSLNWKCTYLHWFNWKWLRITLRRASSISFPIYSALSPLHYVWCKKCRRFVNYTLTNQPKVSITFEQKHEHKHRHRNLYRAIVTIVTISLASFFPLLNRD